MVCIAAFIILCIISIGVAFLSIFKKDIGKKWWKVFKKSWHCVFQKVRLQKCDTNFKDDVKNTILKKVIVKHPKWVKPLSVLIEILSVLIVLITVWSIIIAIKSLLALWVFGTCNVSQPSHCGLGAEACSIDQGEPKNLIEKAGRSLSEWGEIFTNIPDRMKTWNANDYFVDGDTPLIVSHEGVSDIALDIVDPGCSVCLQSYRNQKQSGFFETHNVAFHLYVIQDEDGNEKFMNSGLFTDVYYSALLLGQDTGSETIAAVPGKLLDRLFTEENADHINYQSYLQQLEPDEARQELKSWLKDFGLSKNEVEDVLEGSSSPETELRVSEVRLIVDTKIHAKSIPTLIYDGRKHNGLYKVDK